MRLAECALTNQGVQGAQTLEILSGISQFSGPVHKVMIIGWRVKCNHAEYDLRWPLLAPFSFQE